MSDITDKRTGSGAIPCAQVHMDKLTARESLALAQFLRVMRQLERAELAHHAEITLTLRGRNVSVEARAWGGGGAVDERAERQTTTGD